MLSNARIFTNDAVWRGLLSDLGATIADSADYADIDFDSLQIPSPLSATRLKSKILNAIDSRNKQIMHKVFGRDVALSELQLRIVAAIDAAPVGMAGLKIALGVAPDVATHAIDTAIYNLRKTFGADFIKLENGKYKIGV